MSTMISAGTVCTLVSLFCHISLNIAMSHSKQDGNDSSNVIDGLQNNGKGQVEAGERAPGPAYHLPHVSLVEKQPDRMQA